MTLPSRLLALAPVFIAACAAPGRATQEATGALPLPDYGVYVRPVAAASPEVQAWFDRGLTLVYGFNHEEGILAFARATEFDPTCAMAWWGIAYGNGIEASSDPARALRAAAVLETRVPGSGHLVHMPSHIYITTGRYDQAVRSNQAAIEADEAYFAVNGRPSFYSLYFLHNIHFLAFAAMMEGRSQIALDAVRRMAREVPEEFLRAFPQFADGLMPAQFHVLVRFGRWEEILAEPEYPEFRRVSRSIRRYARAIALANLGRTDDARAELAVFDEEAALVPEDWTVGTNPASIVLSLSRQVAEAEILFKEGKTEAAFEVLRAAQVGEDALVYDEPPGWMLPVRHAHGA